MIRNTIAEMKKLYRGAESWSQINVQPKKKEDQSGRCYFQTIEVPKRENRGNRGEVIIKELIPEYFPQLKDMSFYMEKTL